jgi:hypothetical protein
MLVNAAAISRIKVLKAEGEIMLWDTAAVSAGCV